MSGKVPRGFGRNKNRGLRHNINSYQLFLSGIARGFTHNASATATIPVGAKRAAWHRETKRKGRVCQELSIIGGGSEFIKDAVLLP